MGDTSIEEQGERLAAFLATELGRPGARVEGLGRLSGGASRETFAATLVGPDGARDDLIVQRVRRGALSESFSMVAEASLLRAAAEAGVPVAPVVAATDDGDVFGSPCIVVGRLDGEAIARRILRDDEFAAARSALVGDAAAALAAVHRIPVDAAPSHSEQDAVGQLRLLFDHLGQPHPAFELGFRWIERRRPPAGPVAVVHGDFRLGNLIVGPEGLRAVLDWELAHLGDPVEDLGWFCVKAWRFGAERPVAGLGELAELTDAYSAAGGRDVAPETLHWWMVLGTLRWGVICILQAQTHLSGMSRSVELAAIGRRVCETELDLLDLIEESP
jgi:aminoglycoside phosphotransferase (APT) family kinase protein